MRKTTILLVLALSLLCLPVASAQGIYSDTYVIPAAGHLNGINGMTWASDVSIRNFQVTPLTVQLAFIETGASFNDNVFPLVSTGFNGSAIVPVNGTVLLRDLLNGYRGMPSTLGAIIIGADRPFAVTSRSYVTAGGGMIGETVPAARDFLDNTFAGSDSSAVAYIPGLVNNGSQRTNIGFVAGNGTSDAPLSVEVSIRDASGTLLGTRTIAVPSSDFAHAQFSVASITGTAFDTGSAEVRITGGNGAVVPYASVIDNSTGSAAYIMGQFPAATPPAGSLDFSSRSRSNVFRDLLNRLAIR